MRSTLHMLSALCKWQVGFVASLCLRVQNLPQLGRQAASFSSYVFFFFFFFVSWCLWRRHFCPGASIAGLQQKGPRSQAIAVDYTYPRCLLSDLCRVSFSERLACRNSFSAWFALQSLRSCCFVFAFASVPEDLFSFVLA